MDAAAKMELFQNLFYVSTAVMVIGFGLAIFFFFYFDIRSVRALMTGKAKREVIQRMTEQNARTGTLRATTGSTRDPAVPVVQQPSQVVTADIQPTARTAAPEVAAETTVLVNNEETTILRNNEETTVLRGAAPVTAPVPVYAEESCGETTILSAPGPAVPAIRFDITESTLVIHTNEII